MTNAVLIQQNGFWWPGADTHAHPVIMGDCAEAIRLLLTHLPLDRRVIVQAGACVGVYPIALTDHFACVHTFEPDPVNWACLERNLLARDSLRRVVAHNAALGAVEGLCSPVEVTKGNCGANRVDFGGGDVAVKTIDGLGLERCDAIWLDVEGAELPALKGGERTVERFSPVIVVEDKGLHRAFGIADGALQAWLEARDYAEVGRIGRDKVFRRT